MNYPIQSLVIIAPILFIVLMIVAPLIGVFAGWKRAAYWGGGSLFFFFIGLIVWKTAGAQVVSGLKGVISNLIQQLAKGVTITDNLLVSVTAPIFLIAVMMVAELLLVINYYAWFKRVSGIKKDIKAKKYAKAVKKNDKEKIAKYKEFAKPQGWRQMQLTTKGKVINMAAGGAGLALLLAPSSVQFTQAVFYLTTSAETRATNAFAANLYNSLNKTQSSFSWMSYYGNGSTAKDFDSIFSMIALSTKKISYTYTDANGNEVNVPEGTVTEALVNVITGGFGNVVKQTTEGEGDPVAKANAAIDSLAKNWNNIVQPNETSITTMFQSENISEVLKTVIGDNTTEGRQTLTKDQIEKGYTNSDSVFSQVYEDYLKRSSENQLQQIPVSETTYNNIAESVMAVFEFSTDVDATLKQAFAAKVNEMVGMMFKVA